MSESTHVTETSQESNNTIPDNKDDIIADLQKQLAAVNSKTNELLAETKKAKQKARDEADAKELAKLEKAKREGDYEQLLKSSESERSKLADELNKYKFKISTKEIQNHSLQIATELADGNNAELLSEFIQKRLKYTDDGIKVLDGNGELTVSSIDDLKKEFQNSSKYKSLIRGVKSSGGSAQGSGNSVTHTKEMSRSSFDQMTHGDRSKFMKDGGKLIDN